MIALYVLCLINIALCVEVSENVEENSNKQNTTTLYPIKNLPYHFTNPEVRGDVSKVEKESNDQQTDVTTVKDKKYTHNHDKFKEIYKTMDTDREVVVLNCNESQIYDTINDKVLDTGKESNIKSIVTSNKEDKIKSIVTSNKEDKIKSIVTSNKEDKIKSIPYNEGTKWKIDATYAPSKSTDATRNEYQSRDFENKDTVKDFRPSPHLGSFYDEDSFVIPTPDSQGLFTPYKPPSFGSFEKDFYKMSYKGPVDSHQPPNDTPYKFENVPWTADWQAKLEPRPVELPVKIPAGGLYKLPDAFQEKPSSDVDNDHFGLDYANQQDNSIKQRGNPWNSFLHMVTALLPVGLIVSALTPNVIELQNTSNNNPNFPSRVSRSDEVASSPPRISERCKRRLLCEIHADQNYIRPCYKLHCEDPHAMNAMLRWLLNQHHHTPGYRPSDHDRRGYITRN